MTLAFVTYRDFTSDSPLLSTTQSMTKHNLMELRDFTIDSSIMELYWVNS